MPLPRVIGPVGRERTARLCESQNLPAGGQYNTLAAAENETAFPFRNVHTHCLREKIFTDVPTERRVQTQSGIRFYADLSILRERCPTLWTKCARLSIYLRSVRFENCETPAISDAK